MISYEGVMSFAHDIAERAGYAVAAGSPVSRVVVLSKSGSIAKISD